MHAQCLVLPLRADFPRDLTMETSSSNFENVTEWKIKLLIDSPFGEGRSKIK